MKKIIFGITGLTLGGAERVLVDIANKLVDEYEITIFTIYSDGELEKQLSDKVKIKTLYNFSYNSLTRLGKMLMPIKFFFNKNHVYKKYIKNKYDTEIAFLEGPITNLFAISNNNVKKIAWVHNDILLVFGSGIKSKLKKILNKRVYEKYEKLIFVSKDNLEKFNKVYNINVDKQVIYNYIDKDNVIIKANDGTEQINFNKEIPTFLSVSRLVEQKAIDRFVNVHAKLIGEGYEHKVYIIGDGPLKNQLEQQIEKLNVKDSFILLGKKENPYPYIKKCDVFCLLSYFEGYGMVIEEAKILSKYIAITNTAAREAINGYEYSRIFENSDIAIYEGLKEIIVKKEYLHENSDLNYNNIEILDKIKELIG